jgi:hypothetical protein
MGGSVRHFSTVVKNTHGEFHPGGNPGAGLVDGSVVARAKRYAARRGT